MSGLTRCVRYTGPCFKKDSNGNIINTTCANALVVKIDNDTKLIKLRHLGEGLYVKIDMFLHQTYPSRISYKDIVDEQVQFRI